MYYCQFFSLFNFKRVGACEHIYIKKYCKKLPLTLSLTTVFNLYSEQCWSFIAPSRLFRRHFSRGNMEYMYFFNTIHIGSTPTFLYFDLYLYFAYAAYINCTCRACEVNLYYK